MKVLKERKVLFKRERSREQGEREREGTFPSACTLKNKIKWKDEMGIPVETYAYKKKPHKVQVYGVSAKLSIF